MAPKVSYVAAWPQPGSNDTCMSPVQGQPAFVVDCGICKHYLAAVLAAPASFTTTCRVCGECVSVTISPSRLLSDERPRYVCEAYMEAAVGFASSMT